MPPKHNKQRKEWEVSLKDWSAKQYYCAACRDTGTCKTCQGNGCMKCDYTGTCPECVDAKHNFVEGLA
jgi:hypothetical protein